MELSKQQVRQIWNEDNKKARRLLLLAVLITAVVFWLSLCVRYNAFYYRQKFMPAAYMKSLGTAVHLLIARIFHLPFYDTRDQVIASIGKTVYLGALARLKLTFMAFVTGAAVSVAGAIFQTIYRNPMASPNILGASAGVSMGNIIMIAVFSAKALELVMARYAVCYLVTGCCVAGVLILGRISGDRMGNPSVMNMVMAGSVISQVLNTFVMYFMYELEDDDLQIYQELNLGAYLNTDAASVIVFTVIMAGSLLPVLLLRYRFNVTAMDDSEARAAGINPRPYRFAGQICGVLMATAAMVHCGQIGMLGLVMPYLVRSVAGADFRKVCIYSILSGGTILMICRAVSAFTVIAGIAVPVTFILNIALTPLFMVILVKNRGGFDTESVK